MAKLSPRDLKHLRALAATDARLLGGAASVDIKLLTALLEEYDCADALAARVAELETALRDLLDEITIVIDHPAWRRYELTVKPHYQDDPVEAARRARETRGNDAWLHD